MKIVYVLKSKNLKIHKSTIRSKAEQIHNLENKKNATLPRKIGKCCRKSINAVKSTKRNNGITVTDNDENFK